MNRGNWWATVHGVKSTKTQLSMHTHTHTHTQIRNKGSFWKHERLRQVIVTLMVCQWRTEAENAVKQQRIILKDTSLLSSFPHQQTLAFKQNA